MRVTATEEYGLRCLIHVARTAERSKSATIREIAEKEGMTLQNATKIMAKLKKAGLVSSVRGANGGYVLSKPAD
jgi:Rrf2 family transcriptional regulator, iron-sulfur cluster assembly transcription factor